MTAPRRDRVECHVCGTLLGMLNRGDSYAKARGQTCRIVETEEKVRVFVDLAMSRVELLCPACGAVGRTISRERIRGIVLHLREPVDSTC